MDITAVNMAELELFLSFCSLRSAMPLRHRTNQTAGRAHPEASAKSVEKS